MMAIAMPEHDHLTLLCSLTATLEAAERVEAVLRDDHTPFGCSQHVRRTRETDGNERTRQGGPQRRAQEEREEWRKS